MKKFVITHSPHRTVNLHTNAIKLRHSCSNFTYLDKITKCLSLILYMKGVLIIYQFRVWLANELLFVIVLLKIIKFSQYKMSYGSSVSEIICTIFRSS